MPETDTIAHTADTIVRTIVKQPIAVSDGALILVVLLIAALGMMFYLVFRWMQRAETAGYLGQLYRDSVFEFEKSRLCQRVDQQRSDGEFRQAALAEDPWKQGRPYLSPKLDQLIAEAERKRRGAEGGARGYSARPGGYLPPGLPGLGGSGITTIYDSDEYELPELSFQLDEEGNRLLDDYNLGVRNYNEALRSWKERVQQRQDNLYRDSIREATREAGRRAELAVDVDMGIFRGRGPAFVLEFTAIVVIIFAAVILGILGPLDGQQIGTLLAAIAGYVLGKATADNKQKDEKASDKASKDDKSGAGQASDDKASEKGKPPGRNTTPRGEQPAEKDATGQRNLPAADTAKQNPDAPPPPPQPNPEPVST
jgi:hypothetical protein